MPYKINIATTRYLPGDHMEKMIDQIYNVGTITEKKEIMQKIHFDFHKQMKQIFKENGEPKFIIMNKVAYNQYFIYCFKNMMDSRPDTFQGLPIVMDWTSDKLIRVVMSAFDEFSRLDLEDMEG